MKTNEPLEKLKKECDWYGSQREAAVKYDCTYQLICDILAGRRIISKYMAFKMGYERITRKRGKKKTYTYKPLGDIT